MILLRIAEHQRLQGDDIRDSISEGSKRECYKKSLTPNLRYPPFTLYTHKSIALVKQIKDIFYLIFKSRQISH